MAVALSEPNAPHVQSSLMSGERTPDWREHLPTFASDDLVLREMRLSDAGSLLTMIGEDDVARFLAPPPETQSAFREFIRWTHVKRAEGTYACFAVVPREASSAIGFFQLRALDPSFATAEWGFALGRPVLGHGNLHGGRGAVTCLCVPAHRCPAPGGAGDGGQCARQRGIAQDGRRARRRVAPILRLQWAAARHPPMVDPRGGLALATATSAAAPRPAVAAALSLLMPESAARSRSRSCCARREFLAMLRRGDRKLATL